MKRQKILDIIRKLKASGDVAGASELEHLLSVVGCGAVVLDNVVKEFKVNVAKTTSVGTVGNVLVEMRAYSSNLTKIN